MKSTFFFLFVTALLTGALFTCGTEAHALSAAGTDPVPERQAGPRVQVGRGIAAPVIDGKPDEVYLHGSVEIGNFSVPGNNGLAGEQTKCRLIYDKDNLYILFNCMERVLDPVLNQVDRFRAEVRERDSARLFRDDCVELFIAPGGIFPDYYHIAVNSLGMVYDAREMGGPKSWNGAGIRARGTQDNGRWTVEIAVPFKAFGVSAPGPGDTWRINLCRTQQPGKEYSSWAPVSSKGFHSPERFGFVDFVERVDAAVSG
ncbi:MAG: carbohydrate-binding family 9-like protein, partial [bacterium]|nr:carbohydrate-binding family 9-like protein [bacterium]